MARAVSLMLRPKWRSKPESSVAMIAWRSTGAMEYVKRELARGIDDWEARLSTALVKSSPTDLVKHTALPRTGAAESDKSKVQTGKG